MSAALRMMLSLVVAITILVAASEVVVALAEKPELTVDVPVPTIAPLLGARRPLSRFANHLVIDRDGRRLELHADGLRRLETRALGCGGQIPHWRDRVQLYVDPQADTMSVLPMLAHVPSWPGGASLVVETSEISREAGTVQRLVPIRMAWLEEERSECFVDLRGHRHFGDALQAISHTCVELLLPERVGFQEYVGHAEPWLLAGSHPALGKRRMWPTRQE